MFMKNPHILIIDLGSQYSLVISRTLREIGVRSVVLAPAKVEAWLLGNSVSSIILSGGDASVHDASFVSPPRRILELNVPILGICLGMHWLVKEFGGKVESRPDLAQYGKRQVTCERSSPLFRGLSDSLQQVWESHGDSVTGMPQGFELISKTRDLSDIQALWSSEQRIAAVQFHPEVVDTHEGKSMLTEFVLTLCGGERDWSPAEIIGNIRDEICSAIGGDRAILGFSGGVDSTTGAAMLAPVLGEKLQGFCLDVWQFRENELPEIMANAWSAKIPLVIKSDDAIFMPSGNSPLDREEIAEFKRKIFSALYGQHFSAQAQTFGAKFVIQLSLATDFIESGKAGASALIKSHHNTIAEFGGLKALHPFRHLFKYEVRELARTLQLPADVVARQPFPGPGLLVRWVGGVPTSENLALLRWADARTREVLVCAGEYEKISQLVVAIPSLKITGVKGDGRAYKYPVFIRAVESSDFMTARGYRFSEETQEKLEHVLTAHRDIVAVSYWPTSKPPQTVEFE